MLASPTAILLGSLSYAPLLPTIGEDPQTAPTPVQADALASDEAWDAAPFSTLPRAVTAHGAVVSQGWLYVLGGYFGEPHDYRREFQSRSFARLNLLDGHSWEQLPLEEPVQSLGLVAHRGQLYSVGGMTIEISADGYDELISQRGVRRYDPHTRSWTRLPSLPEGRSSLDATVVGDQLVVVGGWNMQGEDNASWSSDALLLDLSDPRGEWESLEVPFRRRALAVAALGERVYVVGGIQERGGPTSRVDVLDLATRTWSRAADFPAWGFGVDACGRDGALWVSGRDGGLWRLDPELDAWTRVGQQSFPRFFHQLASDLDSERSELFVVGGILTNSRVRSIERLRPRAQEQLPLVATWSLPFPGRAMERQGVMQWGSELVFFGGNNAVHDHGFPLESFEAQTWRLDLEGLRWTAEDDFPVPGQSFMAASFHEGFAGLSVGGFGPDQGVARTLPGVYEYDLRSGSWEERGALELARSRGHVLAHEDALYVFGGFRFDPEAQTRMEYPTAVLRYDAEQSALVETGVELRGARTDFGATVHADRAYLLGGLGARFSDQHVFEAWDFETESWVDLPAPPTHRLLPELVALGGELYALCGRLRDAEGEMVTDRAIEVFDPASQTWSVLDVEVPFETRHARAFALNGRLLVVTQDPERNATQLAWIDVGRAARRPAASASAQ